MKNQFFYHMNLHYSQTIGTISRRCNQFFYHMNLHYSQTSSFRGLEQSCFSTIWIYTTLKLLKNYIDPRLCFSTIWIYTTLKLLWLLEWKMFRFSTIWIYTTLKPQFLSHATTRHVIFPYGLVYNTLIFINYILIYA